VHPKADLRQEKPEFMRGSEHTTNGFFAAAGPAIRARGQIANVEILELAPTFLKLIGEEKPGRMKGEAIRELFEPAAAIL
jgi:predicted AlkP superfamily phosphohydrolase/phosphomutase